MSNVSAQPHLHHEALMQEEINIHRWADGVVVVVVVVTVVVVVVFSPITPRSGSCAVINSTRTTKTLT